MIFLERMSILQQTFLDVCERCAEAHDGSGHARQFAQLDSFSRWNGTAIVSKRVPRGERTSRPREFALVSDGFDGTAAMTTVKNFNAEGIIKDRLAILNFDGGGDRSAERVSSDGKGSYHQPTGVVEPIGAKGVIQDVAMALVALEKGISGVDD